LNPSELKIKQLVFTMGRYDVVGIFEAQNEEAISKALLKLGAVEDFSEQRL